jgi:hypothetical protein
MDFRAWRQRQEASSQISEIFGHQKGVLGDQLVD